MDQKKLKRYVASLKDRGEAYMNQVLARYVEEGMELVQSNAPSGDPEFGNYSSDLVVKEVSAQVIAYAIVYQGRARAVKGKDLDPATTLLYVKPIVNDKSKVGRAMAVLAQYSPFTMQTWPKSLMHERGVLAYRTVRAKDVDRENVRIGKVLPGILTQLRKAGSSFVRDDFKMDDIVAVDDIGMKILKRETTFFGGRGAHWRPSLRELRSSGTIDGIVKDQSIHGILSDVTDKWRRYKRSRGKISMNDVANIVEFHNKIVEGL